MTRDVDSETFPLVSVITPTRDRDRHLTHTQSCVLHQDWPNIEWLIYDDSACPSTAVKTDALTRTTYIHDRSIVTVGEKRNRLISQAAGQYVAHFDDDDYYSSDYVSAMVRGLQRAAADIVKLAGTYVYDQKEDDILFLDFVGQSYLHYSCMPRRARTMEITPGISRALDDRQRLGYGFSYVYKRTLWEANQFPSVDLSEDLAFVVNSLQHSKLGFVDGQDALCLHVVHSHNLSGCYPQYLLPHFFLKKLFPHATVFYEGIE